MQRIGHIIIIEMMNEIAFEILTFNIFRIYSYKLGFLSPFLADDINKF